MTAPLPEDRPVSWRGAVAWAVAGVCAYAIFRLLALLPEAAGATFVVTDAVITRPLSRLTGLLPVSVTELLVAGYLLLLILAAARAARAVRQGRRRAGNAALGGARRLLRDAGVIVVYFYAAWGLNYARPPFAVQAGWPEWTGIDREEAEALAGAAVQAANDAYLELHGAPDAGAPTALGDFGILESAIDAGWVAAAEFLALPPNAAAAYGRVKRPLASELLLRLGIAGIYSPFTGEAHVPRGPPAVALPVSIAHEKAHQRGYTGEADAGFLAFVVTSLAPDVLARYAAALYAQNQLLFALRGVAPEAAERVMAERLPGVERDLADRYAFHARYAGALNEMGSRVNDRYLTTNRVAGGIENYRQSAWLIVALARRNEGEVMPAAPVAGIGRAGALERPVPRERAVGAAGAAAAAGAVAAGMVAAPEPGHEGSCGEAACTTG